MTGGMQFQLWLNKMGVSRADGYKWRKQGWVSTCRVGKLLYISNDAIAEFWRRAEAGEFEGDLAGVCAKE